MIQESKIEDASSCVWMRLVITVWDSNLFKWTEEVVGERFCLVRGLWISAGVECVLLNAHAPNRESERDSLWEQIAGIIQRFKCLICDAGDFNEVKCIEERWGCQQVTRGMMNLESFSSDCGLIDLPLIGGTYTCFNTTNKSRIDRMLFNSSFAEIFGDMRLWCLRGSMSDHCALLLKNDQLVWGPVPFKSIDPWLDHPYFKEVVKEEWGNIQVRGWEKKGSFLKLKTVKSKSSCGIGRSLES